MTAPAQAAPLRPEAGGAAAQELRALTAFCLAPDDDILAAPDSEIWGAARLLDGLGIIAHGAGTPVSAAIRAVFGRPSADPDGVCAWPLTGTRLRPDDGAYVLGVYAFSENYADTGLGSVAHLNSIVVPALLIAIQQRRVTGRQALAALLVGYSVMEWVGATLNGGRPRMAHQLRGFRPTPTAGPLAAVAVLGRLAGLPETELANALGIACSQGGGLRPSTASPLSAIRVQSGEALRRAVHTVMLAQAGIEAHPDVLRCPGGFFPAYTFSEPGPYQVPTPADLPDLMSRVSMKLECTPHTLVTMLDAARQLAGRPGFDPAAVTSVVVRVPSQHNTISGGTKPYPVTFSQAAHHVPYCVALAMVTRSHLYPGVLEAGLADAAVRELTGKVSLVIDDRLTALFDEDPTSWPAVVELESGGAADRVELRAPETARWSAQDALDYAAMKTQQLLDGRGGQQAELRAQFTTALTWPDAWDAISAHPLTTATEGIDGD